MAKNKTTFNYDWIDANISPPEWNRFLKPVRTNKYQAYCTACSKTFELSNMGRQAVVSHFKSRLHHKNVSAQKNTPGLETFFENNEKNIQNNITCTSNLERGSITSSSDFLQNFVLQQNVVDAEILWCFNTVLKHKSLNSVQMDMLVMKKMFCDSKIAEKICLSPAKAAYIIHFGLAPYFKAELDASIMETNEYVICFDEALNKIAQMGQMDILIRFFNSKTHLVQTHYYNSVFLKHASAEILLEKFKEGIGVLKLKHILQVRLLSHYLVHIYLT